MNKDEIIKLAKELHLEAFNANSYYSIMEQYKKYHKEYNSEMNISPAFHHLVYDALQKACFMEIAKLYDKAKGTFSIGTPLKECQDNISIFPEYRDKVSIKDDGNEYSFQVPYQHTLRPSEERFFIDEVTSQRKIYKIFEVSSENKPVQIDLTFPDFLELYQKRFCSLRKKQENICIQRNKIYAHNDGL